MRSILRGTFRGSLNYFCAFAPLALITCCLFQEPACAAGAPPETLSERVARQLIVLFDSTNTLSPPASTIINAVKFPAENANLHGLLGMPSDAHKLLNGITSPARQAELAIRPWSTRARLEQVVVLTYPTAPAAHNAKRLLLKDTRVLSVELNRLFSSSAQPSDKYFPYDPSQTAQPAAGNYQWGMQVLNMPSAWDKVRGTAYVGAIDYGIECPGTADSCVAHPDLQQNLRRQFSKSFYNESSPDNDIDEIAVLRKGVYLRGHGTHVAGIIAATPQYGSFDNHSSNTGVTGTCWTCSLSVLKMDFSEDAWHAALTWGVDHGLQVINMSLGMPTSCVYSYASICLALRHARDHDVVLVASSGNDLSPYLDFPANSSDVIAVGGIQIGGSFWNTGYGTGDNQCTPENMAECGSNTGVQQTDDGTLTGEQQVVAPAMDIISTVYSGVDFNTDVQCGDNFGPDAPGGGKLNGYGDCTGTSMAAPHVTGIAGLLRSVNPLLTRNEIKSILTSSDNTTECVGIGKEKCGAGIPNAAAAVAAALGGPNVVNRLTPLFSFYTKFYNGTETDHFYTVVPQMAVAALSQSLLPKPSSSTVDYEAVGESINGYAQFPTQPCPTAPCLSYGTPKAMLSVFTTHVNPIAGGPELAPLYRYSWSNSTRSGHVYATNKNENWTDNGWKLDGIEGYIYPPSQTQPPGTVKVCRKHDDSLDDYVLFPGSGTNGLDCSATSDGYTFGNFTPNFQPLLDGSDWIGWTYPNGVTPPTVPDAPIIGTATRGYRQVTISFSAPSNDGGSPITSYTVTCTAAGYPTLTATGAASPITVTQLVVGVGYSCSLTATNSVGTSSSSLELPQVMSVVNIIPILGLLLLDD